MRIRRPAFDVELTLDDLAAIRAAIRAAGLSSDVADGFTGSMLHDYLSAWADFVDADWSTWDHSEYSHDIACRYWIQVAIEHSSAGTAARIAEAVRPADEVFESRMVPARELPTSRLPLLRRPYFWETHAIHPELAATSDGDSP